MAGTDMFMSLPGLGRDLMCQLRNSYSILLCLNCIWPLKLDENPGFRQEFLRAVTFAK